jgi:hypothetical protein
MAKETSKERKARLKALRAAKEAHEVGFTAEIPPYPLFWVVVAASVRLKDLQGFC